MFLTQPWLKALSALSINLSAAWFDLAILTPNFAKTQYLQVVIALTLDFMLGILFLLFTVKIEGLLQS